MNERIREFAEQCVGSRPYNTFDYEKFAKLIIKECCNQLNDPNRYSDGDFAKWRIHQHFGLEYESIHQ